jgi:uncharacterized protein (TIGR02246 family)
MSIVNQNEQGEKMSAVQHSEDLQQLFEAYGTAWASLDPERIAAFHTEDGVFCLHGGDGEDVVGRNAIKDAFGGFIAQWPDLGFEPVRVRFGSGFAVAEWKFSGTLQGSLDTPDGTAEGDGKRIEWDAVDVYGFDGGLISRKDTYVDAVSVQAQLAAAAVPQAA